MAIPLDRYIKLLVFCKLGSHGISISPGDIEFIGDNGVAACLVRPTGEEYLWFETEHAIIDMIVLQTIILDTKVLIYK